MDAHLTRVKNCSRSNLDQVRITGIDILDRTSTSHIVHNRVPTTPACSIHTLMSLTSKQIFAAGKSRDDIYSDVRSKLAQPIRTPPNIIDVFAQVPATVHDEDSTWLHILRLEIDVEDNALQLLEARGMDCIASIRYAASALVGCTDGKVLAQRGAQPLDPSAKLASLQPLTMGQKYYFVPSGVGGNFFAHKCIGTVPL